MVHSLRNCSNLPPEQEAIRARCFHPSGTFVEFTKEEVEQSIPERFDKIVRMYPDRVAVKHADQTVTYAELNTMANCLAREMVKGGHGKSKPIGILLDKGARLVASMLGVLRAGHILIPLDPLFPQERLVATLADSAAECVISDHKNLQLARRVMSSDRNLIDFDSIDFDLPDEELHPQIKPGTPACIIYTSGSTGQPKGVVQSHRNVLHTILIRTNDSHICPADKVADLTIGTANSIFDALFALLNGALLIPFDVRKKGVHRMAAWLSKERITLCAMSSRLFRTLCHSLTGAETFPDLRCIRLRSETAYRSDVDMYRKYFCSTCVLVNGLSSTETGYLRLYGIDHATAISDDQVPVGYACDDKDILLVDEEGKEVCANEVGEIVVRSRYLSPGYWRNPDLTEVKFKPDPEGGDNRLYYTGDLGLMRADGCLIHKGRKDFRVKVRGYGVDLMEVENTLRSYPSVKDAVVTIRANESGEARLLGYFTVGDHECPTVTELRRFLLEHLPDYMVPAGFVRLDVMPTTANGKVDRRSLPAPDDSRPELEVLFIPPETPMETQLIRIWGQILGLNRIGIHDNFFDLGGHSLAASRVVSQVIQEFQIEVPLQALFQSPTIAEMAAVITARQAEKLGTGEFDGILTEVESLSDEQAQRLLDNQPVVERL